MLTSSFALAKSYILLLLCYEWFSKNHSLLHCPCLLLSPWVLWVPPLFQGIESALCPRLFCYSVTKCRENGCVPIGLFSVSRGSQRSWYGTALSWGFTDLMGCRQESAVPEPAVTDFFKDHVFPPTRQIKFSGTLFPYILNFEQLDYTFMSSRCHNH